MMKKIFLGLSLLFIMNGLRTQSFDHIVLDNKLYVKDIHSVKLTLDGLGFGQPILILNSSEKLWLRFDDFQTDARFLKYTLIHCTHDWKVSDMSQIEYIEGFPEDQIQDFSYSLNTIQSYVHYELRFPNDFMNITKSGNYILFVYEDDTSKPILTRRLMIVEPMQAGVSGRVKSAANVEDMYTRQEVDFVVNTGSYTVRDPSLYLNATIMQNGRWDNAIVGLKYRSGKPGEFSFDYDDNQNSFSGSSEFRTFDTRTLFSNGDRIVSIGFRNNTNYVYVFEDRMRPYGAYETNSTLKGKCYFRNSDYQGKNREDYVDVIFSLRPDYDIIGGDVYVFGELTDWQIKEEAKVRFNPEINYWEAKLYLKQGYFNYQYVYVKNGTNRIDETYIEGSHWETGNEYTVLIYLQDEGDIYDKLIGFNYFTITP